MYRTTEVNGERAVQKKPLYFTLLPSVLAAPKYRKLGGFLRFQKGAYPVIGEGLELVGEG